MCWYKVVAVEVAPVKTVAVPGATVIGRILVACRTWGKILGVEDRYKTRWPVSEAMLAQFSLEAYRFEVTPMHN